MAELGALRIYFGPMFSGKSTFLRQDLTQLADLGNQVLLINHSSDIRETEASDGQITTHHSGFKGLSEKISIKSVSFLDEVNVEEVDVIGVDEGQFFKNLEKTIRNWVLVKGKKVIVASLDGTSELKPFGDTHKLICLTSNWGGKPGLTKLNAKCVSCSLKTEHSRFEWVSAGFTMCKAEKDCDILVGGSDVYSAVCLKCHNISEQ